MQSTYFRVNTTSKCMCKYTEHAYSGFNSIANKKKVNRHKPKYTQALSKIVIVNVANQPKK